MSTKPESISYTPIGFLRSAKVHKAQAGRQPWRFEETESKAPEVDIIELNPGENFEQALSDLQDFSHIWVLFHFHESKAWRPMIRPPRGVDRKVGVFASRSPYRPNSVGLSLVRLVKIEGRRLFIQDSDLIDGTPILDIKPYVTETDRADQTRSGWMQFLSQDRLRLRSTDEVSTRLGWLKNFGFDLEAIIKKQLELDPLREGSKRVREIQALPEFLDRVHQADSTIPKGESLRWGEYRHRLWRVLFAVTSQDLILLRVNHIYQHNLDAKTLQQLRPLEISIYQAFRQTFPMD